MWMMVFRWFKKRFGMHLLRGLGRGRWEMRVVTLKIKNLPDFRRCCEEA